MRLILASRQSDLAKIQALQVAQKLREAWPNLETQHYFRESLGDINLNDPLWKMPERGVFTEDFVRGLETEEFDAVIHSWKDLPTESRPHTEIIATLPREDVRDVLLLSPRARPGTKWRILSSSPRRAENLKDFFFEFLPFPPQEVEFVPVRGNVPRRIEKLQLGEGEALIVAKAALDRLLGDQLLSDLDPQYSATQRHLRQTIRQLWSVLLPIELNPPAAAQGALAIEIKRGREDVRRLFEKINCPETFSQVENERLRLRAFGGGCHLKIGVNETVVKTSGGFLGHLRVERGQTPEGKNFSKRFLIPATSRPELPSALRALVQSDPQTLVALRSRDLFEAQPEALGPEQQQQLPQAHWYIAHRQALTLELAEIAKSRTPQDPWIWCSGLESWRKLARLGIWVRGCDEGLGRQGLPLHLALGSLVESKIPWIKLSHADSVDSSDPSLPTIATYRNVVRKNVDLKPQIERGVCFYWHSAQLCAEALRLVPEIRNREHACGLGLTATRMSETLGQPLSSRTFLGETDWRDWCSGIKNSEDP